MLLQLVIGTIVISFTIITQVVFISAATSTLTRYGQWLAAPPFILKNTFVLVFVVLWQIAGITINVWCWALLFFVVDNFATMESAVYFATVTFTTLGYGDIVMSPEWRLLSALTAVNGLIIFGLTTAFLVEFIFQLRKTQQAREAESE